MILSGQVLGITSSNLTENIANSLFASLQMAPLTKLMGQNNGTSSLFHEKRNAWSTGGNLGTNGTRRRRFPWRFSTGSLASCVTYRNNVLIFLRKRALSTLQTYVYLYTTANQHVQNDLMLALIPLQDLRAFEKYALLDKGLGATQGIKGPVLHAFGSVYTCVKWVDTDLVVSYINFVLGDSKGLKKSSEESCPYKEIYTMSHRKSLAGLKKEMRSCYFQTPAVTFRSHCFPHGFFGNARIPFLSKMHNYISVTVIMCISQNLADAMWYNSCYEKYSLIK